MAMFFSSTGSEKELEVYDDISSLHIEGLRIFGKISRVKTGSNQVSAKFRLWVGAGVARYTAIIPGRIIFKSPKMGVSFEDSVRIINERIAHLDHRKSLDLHPGITLEKHDNTILIYSGKIFFNTFISPLPLYLKIPVSDTRILILNQRAD